MSMFSPVDARTVSHAEYARMKAAAIAGRAYMPPTPGSALGLSDSEYAAAKAAALAGSHQPANTHADTPTEAPQTGVDLGTTASTARAPGAVSTHGRGALDMTEVQYAAAKHSLLAPTSRTFR